MAQPQLKTTTATTKTNPMRRSRSSCEQSGNLLKKTTLTNNLHMIKNNPMPRSRSECDLKLAGRTMLKRTATTTTVNIPAKLKKENTSTSSISSTSSATTSRTIGTRPKLPVSKTVTTSASVRNQVKKKIYIVRGDRKNNFAIFFLG